MNPPYEELSPEEAMAFLLSLEPQDEDDFSDLLDDEEDDETFEGYDY